MSRRFRVCAGSWVLCAIAGCTGAHQTADLARVPVLLGPVKCIGCEPAGRRAPGALGNTSDEAQVEMWSIALLSFDGGVDQVMTDIGGTPSSLAKKVNDGTGSACAENMVLHDVAASSYGVNGLFFLHTKSVVTVSGTANRVPNGTCDPTVELWPVSGPRGITWPEQPEATTPQHENDGRSKLQ